MDERKGQARSNTGAMRTVRMSRAWVDGSALSVGLAFVALGSVGTLLIEPEPPSTPPVVAMPARREPVARSLASPAAPRRPVAPSAAEQARPEPPGRPAPERRAAPDLSPLARRWREAVARTERVGIIHASVALRRAPDGLEQLELLAQDTDPRVRAFALRELGSRKERRLVPAFRRALEDPSEAVRANARWALAELGEMP